MIRSTGTSRACGAGSIGLQSRHLSINEAITMPSKRKAPTFAAIFTDPANTSLLATIIATSRTRRAGSPDARELVLAVPGVREELDQLAREAGHEDGIENESYRGLVSANISEWTRHELRRTDRPDLQQLLREHEEAAVANAAAAAARNATNRRLIQPVPNAAPAAAAPSSNVVPSNGHVQPVQPQQPMGAAMSYAQQQALLAAQQQLRHQP